MEEKKNAVGKAMSLRFRNAISFLRGNMQKSRKSRSPANLLIQAQLQRLFQLVFPRPIARGIADGNGRGGVPATRFRIAG